MSCDCVQEKKLIEQFPEEYHTRNFNIFLQINNSFDEKLFI